MAQLGLLVDGVIAQVFAMENSRQTIGRSAQCDIRIDDVGVSTVHAAIIVGPSEYLDGHDEFVIEDLQSRNGTLVNDRPVTRARLHPEDVITVGFNRFKLLDASVEGRESTVLIVMD